MDRDRLALTCEGVMQGIDMDLDELTPEELELLGQIKDRKRVLVAAHRRRKSSANNNPVMPRGRDVERTINTGEMRVHLSSTPIANQFAAPCSLLLGFSATAS